MGPFTYDKPLAVAYNFPNMDFGASSGATVHTIAGPAGMKGRLLDIAVGVTEVFETVTTLAHVQVGTSADADAYGKLNIPQASADNTVVNSTDDPDAILVADIPAETAVHVTLTEGTGASLTGQGYPTVYIGWY
jgi:hypothetical protein